MGSKRVRFPEASSQERELQGFQLDLLRQQREMLSEQLRLQDLFAPFLYKQAGLKPRYDGGKIVGFEEIPDELDPLRKDIEKGYLERSQKALKGELDVDPALERGIAESRQSLEQSLAQQLGPGYATSTPGVQALAEASSRANELRASARRGEMTLAEGLGLARGDANARGLQQQLANLAGAFQVPGAGFGNSVGALNSLGQALGLYGGQRQMQLQHRMFNAQQPGFMDFLGQLLLSAVGGAAGGAGAYGARKAFG
jgi:hypothetical protein